MGYHERPNNDPDKGGALTRATWIPAALVVLLAGCAAITPNLPAITDAPTGDRATGKVVWHDLITDTPAASMTFYGELFGWTFETPAAAVGVGGEGAYKLIRHEGELIGGIVDAAALNRDEDISQWITVMSVADIDSAAAAVEAAGGEVLTAPTDVGSRGTMAVVAGPDRAIIAFLQTRDGDPEPREPVFNGWLWDELWTDDLDTTADFFAAVAGLQPDDRAVPDSDSTYRLLVDGDQPRAGILSNPFEGAPPVWVNYIRVADPAAITARVESLGGRVIVDAQPRNIGGTVAFVAGPSGAGVALQTWPLDQQGGADQ